jgi:hypothetical protein
MHEQQARRLASSEALFRSVNEEMVGLNDPFGPVAQRCVFVCECSRVACAERVELTLAEYARVRDNPRWFIFLPLKDHFLPEIERILERNDRYLLVEKLGVAADQAKKLAGKASGIAASVNAELHLLPASKGGRRAPIRSGYRALARGGQVDERRWAVGVTFEAPPHLAPGDSALVRLTVWANPRSFDVAGTEIHLYEGRQPIGTAIVRE